jgi:hypothetical protein
MLLMLKQEGTTMIGFKKNDSILINKPNDASKYLYQDKTLLLLQLQLIRT